MNSKPNSQIPRKPLTTLSGSNAATSRPSATRPVARAPLSNRENIANSIGGAGGKQVPAPKRKFSEATKPAVSSRLLQTTAASRARAAANEPATKKPRLESSVAAGSRRPGSILGRSVPAERPPSENAKLADDFQRRFEEMAGVMDKLSSQVSSLNSRLNESGETQAQLQELADARKEELHIVEARYEQEVSSASVEHLQQLSELNSKLRASEEMAEERRLRLTHYETQVDAQQSSINSYLKQLEEQTVKIRELLNSNTEAECRHRVEVEGMNQKLQDLQIQLGSLEISLQSERTQNSQRQITIAQRESEIARLQEELQHTIDRMSEELRLTTEALQRELQATTQRLTAQISSIQSELDNTRIESSERADRVMELERLLAKQQDQIDYLEDKARVDEALRRKLHNTIQELKGNIRVICRVRPFLGSEAAGSVRYEFSKKNPQELVISSTENGRDLSKHRSASSLASDQIFKFDRVFGPDARQAAVFEEISHLVQSALDGYNCCIFAYGQTGSGKTFTMEGPSSPGQRTPESEGMIQRAVNQIFDSAEKLKTQGWAFDFTASFVEIYNETLRDLLIIQSKGDSIKYEIRHDSKSGSTSVSNLTAVAVKTPMHVHELLDKANKSRATASTNMNEYSSRSHSVFQLFIRGRNTLSNESIEGLLNLIDLAGSERLDSSGATGSTLKETIAINSSLANLGNCIQALANGDRHVPYRNSKLTYLLQNSLGGNSKTLMFVNVSPADVNLRESLNSLRFAAKVNACDIGTARKTSKVQL